MSDEHDVVTASLNRAGFSSEVVNKKLGIHEIPLESGHYVRMFAPSHEVQSVHFAVGTERNYQGKGLYLGTAPGQDFDLVRHYHALPEDVGDHMRTFMRDPGVVHAIRNDLNERRLRRKG